MKLINDDQDPASTYLAKLLNRSNTGTLRIKSTFKKSKPAVNYLVEIPYELINLNKEIISIVGSLKVDNVNLQLLLHVIYFGDLNL